MFKRYSIGALVIIVLVLGVVGTVLARSNNTSPKDDFCPQEEQTCGGDTDASGDGHHGMMHDIFADALGMTDQELSAAMSDGQTIADLAAAQGVELDDLEMPHAEHMKDLGADYAGCGMMEGGTQSGHLHHQDGHCSDSFTPTQPGE